MLKFDIYKITEKLTEFEDKIGVKRVPPVWGDKMSPEEYFHHMNPRVESGRRLLLPGELGCALAHLQVYKSILNHSNSALILESDIELTKHKLERADDVIERTQSCDFIHLSKYRLAFRKSVIGPELYSPDTSQSFWGTAAYFVSVRMAAYLRSHHERYIDLADNWQEIFVNSPYPPIYSPIFPHAGDISTIKGRNAAPQNPSIGGVLRLRILRARMVFFSAFRYRRFTRLVSAQLNR